MGAGDGRGDARTAHDAPFTLSLSKGHLLVVFEAVLVPERILVLGQVRAEREWTPFLVSRCQAKDLDPAQA